MWDGAAGALLGAIVGGCIPLAWSALHRRAERKGEVTGMLAEFFRIRVQLGAFLEAGIAAPLYRLPISMTAHVLPKLIGDGVLDRNEVYALIEWVNRIEEVNRGLDRAGAAHAVKDEASAQDEYSRNLAKVREIFEQPLRRHGDRTLLDAVKQVLIRVEEGDMMRRLARTTMGRGRRLRAALTAMLGIAGLLLGVLGFYVDKANEFPKIERILAPDCYGEQQATDFLIAHGSIDAANPNFDTLARLIEAKIAALNPSVPLKNIRLQSVRVTTSAITSGGGVAPTLTQNIEMRFADVAKPVEDTLAPYKKIADDQCETSNLKWSTWIFWPGVVLALGSILIALFSDRRGERRESSG